LSKPTWNFRRWIAQIGREGCLFLKEVTFKLKRAAKKGQIKKRKRWDASLDAEKSGDDALPIGPSNT
jgi:hypothetical protein